MNFFEQLERRARQINSLLCVGLDPHPTELGEASAQAARDFCIRLILATSDLALAYKPNAAFFELYGAEGWKALQEVVQAVPHGIPVVLDAKRGDIASTADAYASAVFEGVKVQAVTLSPYLGQDSLQPFLSKPELGAFLLCKTSNPGSADLQDLPLAGEAGALLVYEKVALLAQKWNQNNNLGLVVGATHPQSLRRVRALAPDLWILAPGVGAQGGDLRASLQAGLRADGLGMLVPISRAISQAADPRQAAGELRDAINREREALTQRPWMAAIPDLVPAELAEKIANGLLESGCVKFGEFKLKSGLISPIYLDLRQLASYPVLLSQAAAAYSAILRTLNFQRLAALPYAALPIATAISLQTNWPMLYPRKEAKEYGTRAEIEGVYQAGEQVVVIDDLATTGGSKFEAIEKLTAASLKVQDVVVLIDRQSGAKEALQQAGYQLHAVFTLKQLLAIWETSGQIPAVQIQNVQKFLEG
jgi:uridine monophosphate synthetase